MKLDVGARVLLASVLLALPVAGCASANISGAGYASTAAGSGVADPESPGDGSLKVVSNLPLPKSAAGDQTIRIGDKISVDVFGVDTLDTAVQVDGSGRILLPLIGGVQAAGSTASALQAKVTQLYSARYLQNPEITLSVEQTVTVDGEFRKAGFYPVSANSSLLRIVAAAGNFTEIGDPTNVFVYRTIDGQDYVAQYDMSEIRAGRRPDAPILGGDVVVAFPSGMKVLTSNLTSALGLARSASILY